MKPLYVYYDVVSMLSELQGALFFTSKYPSMAQLLRLSSASPRFYSYVAALPGNGVSRLVTTSARSAVRGMSRRSVRLNSVKSVRCEQGSKSGSGPGLDVWLSRGAMLGFVGAVGVELTTGKGVLQNVGLMAPLPVVALALTGVVGVVTAFLILQSGSSD